MRTGPSISPGNEILFRLRITIPIRIAVLVDIFGFVFPALVLDAESPDEVDGESNRNNSSNDAASDGSNVGTL